MRIYLAAAILSATVSLAASADDLTADTSLAENDRVVRSVGLDDLKAIAVAEGHNIEAVGENGDVSLRATTPDGLIFHLIGTACDTEYSTDCLGFMVQIRYDSDSDVTTEAVSSYLTLSP